MTEKELYCPTILHPDNPPAGELTNEISRTLIVPVPVLSTDNYDLF